MENAKNGEYLTFFSDFRNDIQKLADFDVMHHFGNQGTFLSSSGGNHGLSGTLKPARPEQIKNSRNDHLIFSPL